LKNTIPNKSIIKTEENLLNWRVPLEEYVEYHQFWRNIRSGSIFDGNETGFGKVIFPEENLYPLEKYRNDVKIGLWKIFKQNWNP